MNTARYFTFSLFIAAFAIFASAETPQEKALRQARSVHLWHAPVERNAASVVGSVKVTETQPATYFMTIGFDGGYCGIQDVRGGRWLIFSIWDAVDFEARKHMTAEEREENSAKILFSAPGVETIRFGGEGTGARTMANIGWKVGETVRFRVDAEPHATNRTAYTFSRYDFEKKEWNKLAAISTPNPKGVNCKWLNGIYSFVEDFAGNYKSAQVSRRAEYFDFATRKPGSDVWLPVKSAWFGVDDTNASLHVDAGLAGAPGAFFLQTGGATTNAHTKIKHTIK